MLALFIEILYIPDKSAGHAILLALIHDSIILRDDIPRVN